MEESRAKKKTMEILLEDLERKTSEYESENQRLGTILERCGVSEDRLSAEGQSALHIVAQVAGELSVKDTSETSFVLGLSNLRKRQSHTACQLKLAELEAKDLKEKRRTLQATKNTIAETLKREKVNRQNSRTVAEESEKKREFLLQKSKQYSRQIDALKKQLQSLGYDPAITHQALMKQANDIDAKKARLESVEQQLSAYRDLPLDLEMAKLKVEEARKELSDLREELSQKIDQHHATT
jgi:chromosome segregation ATPase